MTGLKRRDFIKFIATAGVASSLGLVACSKPKKSVARVIVVGGGFGGSTCAKYLRRADANINITLVEPSTQFVTCPFSNTVIGGMQDIKTITHGYNTLQSKYNIKIVHDVVTSISPQDKKLAFKNGKSLQYDRLVISPGIAFKWDAIEGYNENTSQTIPHAWKAGEQTLLLRKQLQAMEDGGVVIISAPGNPFRCPPGPYERACLIAHYLTTHKPKSKILILDTKEKFSKQGLFTDGWNKNYPGMIEWVSGSSGGIITKVDSKNMAVTTILDNTHQAQVLNIIPPQKAALLAQQSDLVDDSGWCPVDQRTFESKLQKDIHIIGDACIAGKMPKSGFAANSQAKVCAFAVAALLNGEKPAEPSYSNTCYSLVAPDYAISVAKVYRHSDKGIVGIEGSGGISPTGADANFRKSEAQYARGWYASITSDTFG